MAHDPKSWTIILVSGAWHVKLHCLPPAPYFEAAGYNYIPLPLPAAGGLTSTLEENLSTISSTVLTELQKPQQQVALILHSAAGLIGTEAINRVLASQPSYCPRIRIIYLASMLDYTPVVSHLAQSRILRVDHEIGGFWCETGYKAFYEGDMSEIEAAPYVEALTFHKAMGQDWSPSSEAWRNCDLTHVVCLKDQVIPVEWQVNLAEEFSMRVVKMDTAHCPFVTRPKEFVEVVDGVLREGVRSKLA